MTDRVNTYYQQPASRALVEHFRREIGLTQKYIDIFDDLRQHSGDTQLHADNVGLPRRQYCDYAGELGKACVRELIRLAEIGLSAEQQKKE